MVIKRIYKSLEGDKMFEYKVKGYEELNDIDLHLFKRFCKEFYEVWEYPERVAPIEVSKVVENITFQNNKTYEKHYLKVELKDGDWLHVLNNNGKLEWY